MPHKPENPAKNLRPPAGGNRDGSNPKNAGRKRIGRKIAHLIEEEGKTRTQAAGQAFGMARAGDLGAAAKRAAGKRRRKKAS